MSNLFREQPAVEPVWQVIPRFFRYPFKGKVLPTVAVISVASAATLIPFLGFFLGLILWIVLFKFSYEVLSSTASGELEGPQAVTGMSDGIMFKHIGLLIGLGLGYGFAVAFTASMTVAIGLGAFLLLALPAAVMTLAMTQSLVQALNPWMWVQIMKTTGVSYVLTSVFLLLLLFSQAQAESILLPVFGGSMALLLIVSTFISAYFMVASFHLMGYLLYQFHDELGIQVHEPVTTRKSAEPLDPVLETAAGMVQDGDSEGAATYLGRQIKLHGAARPVHEYYRKLLETRGDTAALLAHGQIYLATLLHGFDDPSTALRVTEDCLRLDRSFEPMEPADVLPLARLAFEQQRYPLVLQLTAGFGKRHPKHPHVVDNYLLAARSLIERGQEEKAVNLLRQLKKRFPDHPLAEEVARIEAGFSALQAQPGVAG